MPRRAGGVPDALLGGGYSVLGLAGQTGEAGVCGSGAGGGPALSSREIQDLLQVTRPAPYPIPIVTRHHQNTGVGRRDQAFIPERSVSWQPGGHVQRPQPSETSTGGGEVGRGGGEAERRMTTRGPRMWGGHPLDLSCRMSGVGDACTGTF